MNKSRSKSAYVKFAVIFPIFYLRLKCTRFIRPFHPELSYRDTRQVRYFHNEIDDNFDQNKPNRQDSIHCTARNFKRVVIYEVDNIYTFYHWTVHQVTYIYGIHISFYTSDKVER